MQEGQEPAAAGALDSGAAVVSRQGHPAVRAQPQSQPGTWTPVQAAVYALGRRASLCFLCCQEAGKPGCADTGGKRIPCFILHSDWVKIHTALHVVGWAPALIDFHACPTMACSTQRPSFRDFQFWASSKTHKCPGQVSQCIILKLQKGPEKIGLDLHKI